MKTWIPALSLCLCCAGSAQDAVAVESDRIADLIHEGHYQDALTSLRKALRWHRLNDAYDATLSLVALWGEVSLEVGHVADAEQWLTSAARSPSGMYAFSESMINRDMAALLLEKREYRKAAVLAERAYRAAHDLQLSSNRAAYSRSLQAQALLSLGEPSAATAAIHDALRAIPSDLDKATFFEPRILYSACLIESYTGASDAQQHCLRGISMAEKSGYRTRDIPLGYVTLAKADLAHGRLNEGRGAALHSLEVTRSLFGDSHPDAIEALEVLARIDLSEGRIADAHTWAIRALRSASFVFGEGSATFTTITNGLQPALHPELSKSH